MRERGAEIDVLTSLKFLQSEIEIFFNDLHLTATNFSKVSVVVVVVVVIVVVVVFVIIVVILLFDYFLN